jgi:protein ImuA
MLIQELQKEIAIQAFKKASCHESINFDLGLIEQSFAGNVFPIGAVHEFISYTSNDLAATNGFIAGLAGKILQQHGFCLWISNKRTMYPPGLRFFGIVPERVFFIDTKRSIDTLWAVEEALKCEALSAVVGELGELSFKESRRLQLAIEKSNVTGFIHRHNPRAENTTACITRWKIQSLASVAADEMPGVGFPRWNVQLEKVRNGKPNMWMVEWLNNSFNIIDSRVLSIPEFPKRKTG